MNSRFSSKSLLLGQYKETKLVGFISIVRDFFNGAAFGRDRPFKEFKSFFVNLPPSLPPLLPAPFLHLLFVPSSPPPTACLASFVFHYVCKKAKEWEGLKYRLCKSLHWALDLSFLLRPEREKIIYSVRDT